jgi:hypothetical protein
MITIITIHFNGIMVTDYGVCSVTTCVTYLLYNVGLHLDNGHKWPKHVRQKCFTFITKLLTLEGLLFLFYTLRDYS